MKKNELFYVVFGKAIGIVIGLVASIIIICR